MPVATLNNPGPAANDEFGRSVAVSGTRVAVVGAYQDDLDTARFDKGSAYVLCGPAVGVGMSFR